MLEVIQNLKNLSRLRYYKIDTYRPQIHFNINCGKYIIKTAENPNDLKQCLVLRNLIFNLEFCGIDKSLDIDQFDYFSDHLMILNKETSELIGTYRLKTSDTLKNSYTSLEFKLDNLFKNAGPYLELGRACIKKDYRKGSVISLLWRGIAEYMKLTKAQVLFGCSSVKINNSRDAALLYSYLLQQNFYDKNIFCTPQKKYIMPDLSAWLLYFENNYNQEHQNEAEDLLPSLLKSYIKYGALVAALPAFDKEFNCIDFLTVLKKDSLSNSLSHKYNLLDA